MPKSKILKKDKSETNKQISKVTDLSRSESLNNTKSSSQNSNYPRNINTPPTIIAKKSQSNDNVKGKGKKKKYKIKSKFQKQKKVNNHKNKLGSNISAEIDTFFESTADEKFILKKNKSTAKNDSTTNTSDDLITLRKPEIINNVNDESRLNQKVSLITHKNFSESDNDKSFPQIIPANMPVIDKNFLSTWGSIDHKNFKEKKSFLVRGGGIVARSVKAKKYLFLIIFLFILEILAIGAYKLYERLTRIDIQKQIALAINYGEQYINKNFLDPSNGVLKMNEFKRQNAVYKYNKNAFTHNIIKINFNNFNEFAVVFTTNANVHLTGAKAVPDFKSACSIVIHVYVNKGVDGSSCYDPNNHSGIYDNQHLKDWGKGWIDDANYYLDQNQFNIYGENLIKFFGRLKLSELDATIYPFKVGGEGIFWKDIALSPSNLKYINFKPESQSLKVYFKTLAEFTMDDVFPETADSSRFDNVYSYFYDPQGLKIHQPEDKYGYFVLADINGIIGISLDEQTELLKRNIIQYNHNQYIEKPWSVDWSKVTDADLTKGFKLPIFFGAVFPSYVFLQQQ